MNQPLSSNEQAKVFFFGLLLTPLVFVGGAGILLVLPTLWGLRMLRNTHDFSYIDTIRTIHKGFAGIASTGIILYHLHGIVRWMEYHDLSDLSYEDISLLVLLLLIYPVYSFLFDWLFYTPLTNHKEWVVANGIFSTTEADNKPSASRSLFTINKPHKLSVADELLKWNNLKEAGLVTEEEFAKARKDLLK